MSTRIEIILWRSFWIATLILAILMPFEIGDVLIEESVSNIGLRGTLLFLVKIADALWIMLGAGVLYFFEIAAERKNGRIIYYSLLAAIVLLSGFGSIRDVPFGAFDFTNVLGRRLFGVIPLAVPFLWSVIILSSRYTVTWLFPGMKKWKQSLLAGGIVVLTDFNMEIIAWKVRAWWIWYPYGTPLAELPPSLPPLQNYVVWFVFSSLIVFLFPSFEKLKQRPLLRPVLLLGGVNALFLLTHFVRCIHKFL